ncbi:MAG: hypothetical protein K0S68_891 [Candidatus Saccharibacteria bacterium]|nr:hypothetical protein [Candidatus Saccharibacteria bacterium]
MAQQAPAAGQEVTGDGDELDATVNATLALALKVLSEYRLGRNTVTDGWVEVRDNDLQVRYKDGQLLVRVDFTPGVTVWTTVVEIEVDTGIVVRWSADDVVPKPTWALEALSGALGIYAQAMIEDAQIRHRVKLLESDLLYRTRSDDRPQPGTG